MVILSKIIDGLEMVDDIVDCYYNQHKYHKYLDYFRLHIVLIFLFDL